MPGTIIRERPQRLPRTIPTDTGVLFLAGPAERGRLDQVHQVRNMSDVVRFLGSRVTYSFVYDMLEAFFQEGGTVAYVARVFGPAITPVAGTAKVTLNDAGAQPSLIVEASSPGIWGNNLRVAVINGDNAGEFKLVLTSTADASLNETSKSFVTQTDAVEWYRNHDCIRVSLGASATKPAVIGATALSGGVDDHTNATDTQWQAALDRFTKSLGPGQVAYAGRTSSTAQQQLLNHGAANNRVALCDHADSTSKATLLAAASTFRGLNNAKAGGLFGPWVNIPALSSGGSVRAIPASAVIAGLMARNDAAGRSPNEPSAGDLGFLNYAVDIRAYFTDQDGDDLNAAALNLIRNRAGNLKLFGYRTGADKTNNPLYWQMGNARLYMAIAAKADAILEHFVLRQIDGRRLVFKELESQLVAMLQPYYEKGSLFGATPEQAYYVDTDSVNTPASIAASEIHAAIELTMSPMGETVILDIVRRSIS